jgi:hypothetical protein
VNAEEIAARLGQAARGGKGWWECLCPICGKPKLGLRDNPKGRVKLSINCWSGCDKKAIRAYLKRQHFLNGAGNGAAPPETEEEREDREAAAALDRNRKIDEALDIWRNQSKPYKGTAADTYAHSRLLLEYSPALRFVPALYHKLEKRKFPALIGLVEHQTEGAVGIHAIFLNPLDPKSKLTNTTRKLSYGPVGGGAIRLFPLAGGDTLAITEGIEDAITFYQAHKIPTWCTPTANGIKGFVPPPLGQIRSIIISEDQEPVGRRAVAEKADELARLGYRVQIARALVGKDPNAALLELGLDKPLCDLEDYQHSPEFSDDYLALLFSSRHSRDLRYVALWGKWLQWIKTNWQQENTLNAFDLARSLCREIANSADDKLKNDLAGSQTIAAVERLARSDRRHATTHDHWDADDWLFNHTKKDK